MEQEDTEMFQMMKEFVIWIMWTTKLILFHIIIVPFIVTWHKHCLKKWIWCVSDGALIENLFDNVSALEMRG